MNIKMENINKAMGNLTKEQKKIICVTAVILAFLFSFWFFIYAPKKKEFSSIKSSLLEAESQIKAIMDIVEGRDLALATRDLRKTLIEVSSKLPKGEDVAIYNLSEQARNLGIEVKNISPLARKPLEERISGYAIEEFPISINLVSEFKAFGEYLLILRNNFPVLVRVRAFDINGRGEGETSLDINLQLSAYLSSTK